MRRVKLLQDVAGKTANSFVLTGDNLAASLVDAGLAVYVDQDEARKSTRRLVILFSLAVFSIVVITNIVLMIALWFFDASIVADQSQSQAQLQQQWQAHTQHHYQDPISPLR